VVRELAAKGLDDVVVFGGGIIPPDDEAELRAAGVARVFTPGAPLEEITSWLEATLDAREAATGHQA
jgi:methylmalonyl-CoA mutase C-terminal domain/subunit